MSGLFITGTDTHIGKTYASVALIHALRRTGLGVNAMKPVAAGLDHPSDAGQLRDACDTPIDPSLLNPIALPDPLAPHLAARRAGVCIDLETITRAYQALEIQARVTVVEGAGGWMVPLGPDLMMSDLVRALDLPVILVVGLRLGCINHALLSARAICADGLDLAGWIGNGIDPAMEARQDNVDTLTELIDAPLLGLLPHSRDRRPAPSRLNLTPLRCAGLIPTPVR